MSADRIVVYDIWSQRVSVFNDEGDLVDDHRLLYNGLPIRRFGCAPNGRLGFTGYSDQTVEGLASEELYRELMTLGWVELGDTAATTVRQRIPGSELRYLGPGDAMPGSIWGHNVAIAAANEGIWLGSSEDYEVELIGWTGETIRRIRWHGPDLNVTQRDVDRYRDALEGSYRRGGDPDWRARFERRWARESENVPDVFPAYDRLMIGDDGVLWVHDYVRPGEPSEWLAFAARMVHGSVRSCSLPARSCWTSAGTGRWYEHWMTWTSSGSRCMGWWRVGNPVSGKTNIAFTPRTPAPPSRLPSPIRRPPWPSAGACPRKQQGTRREAGVVSPQPIRCQRIRCVCSCGHREPRGSRSGAASGSTADSPSTLQ